MNVIKKIFVSIIVILALLNSNCGGVSPDTEPQPPELPPTTSPDSSVTTTATHYLEGYYAASYYQPTQTDCTYTSSGTFCASTSFSENSFIIFDVNSQFIRCYVYSGSSHSAYYFSDSGSGSGSDSDDQYLCYSGTYSISVSDAETTVTFLINKKIESGDSEYQDEAATQTLSYDNLTSSLESTPYFSSYYNENYSSDFSDFARVTLTDFRYYQLIAGLSLSYDFENNILGSAAIDNDGDGFTAVGGDCNDYDSSISPNQVEICDDEIDNDCEGSDELCDLVDADQDGYTPYKGDCDDTNANIHPGMDEILDDGVDNNCDPLADTYYGGLSTEDLSNSGYYYDDYTVTVNESIILSIDLSPYEFDGTISIINTLDGTSSFIDVNSAGNSESYFELVEAGTYTVRISSFLPAELGNYTAVIKQL